MILKTSECWLRGADGALVRFDNRETAPGARGVVVTVHGMGEHLGKYAEWIAFAMGRGYHATGHDQRGHGRTPGQRGDFAFDDLVDDLERCVGVSADLYPGLPVFVLAHSLGGLVALAYAGRGSHEALAGMALSGPLLALAGRMPHWYGWGVRSLARVAPRMPLPRHSDPARLTRDPDRIEAMRRDGLRHRRITARALLEIGSAMERVRMTPELVEVPLLFLVARADAVVSGADALAYASFVSSSDVTALQFPGAYHELLNDLGRKAVYGRICGWFDGRCGG
ncbi:MAG: lysophospholipase [Gemmatimonadota bacterium]